MRKRLRAAALIAVVLTLTIPGFASAQPTGQQPLLDIAWFQDFETDTAGWSGTAEGWYGNVARVASGTNGVEAASGDYYAQFQGNPTQVPAENNGHTGPYSQLGGYNSVWPGAWTTEVAVYIDPAAFEIGEGFDYSVATNGTDGVHHQDFTFNFAKQDSGNFAVGINNGSSSAPMMNLEAGDHAVITEAGWYILEHSFLDLDADNILDVHIVLRTADRVEVYAETHEYDENTIPDVIGGNRYGWFVFISPGITLPVDHSLRQIANSTFPIEYGALSARAAAVDGPGNVQTVTVQGAIIAAETGRARFNATVVINNFSLFGCHAIDSATFTIQFVDGTSMTAVIDENSWTNFGTFCDYGDGTGGVVIVATLTENDSSYEALEQTIGFAAETRETAPGLSIWKGYFINGPTSPLDLTVAQN